MRQRELGTQLRQLRNERGLTQEQVAKHMDWSAAKISRIETGDDLVQVLGLVRVVEDQEPAPVGLAFP